MGVQLLLQSAALPLLAVLLSWRWPRWQWLFAALAMLGVAQWLEPYADELDQKKRISCSGI